MFCSHCGAPIQKNANFCTKCGAAIDKSASNAVYNNQDLEPDSNRNTEKSNCEVSTQQVSKSELFKRNTTRNTKKLTSNSQYKDQIISKVDRNQKSKLDSNTGKGSDKVATAISKSELFKRNATRNTKKITNNSQNKEWEDDQAILRVDDNQNSKSDSNIAKDSDSIKPPISKSELFKRNATRNVKKAVYNSQDDEQIDHSITSETGPNEDSKFDAEIPVTSMSKNTNPNQSVEKNVNQAIDNTKTVNNPQNESKINEQDNSGVYHLTDDEIRQRLVRKLKDAGSPIYLDETPYPRGEKRDSYEYLDHFIFNIWTVIFLIIEYFGSMFFWVLTTLIPPVNWILHVIPFDFVEDGGPFTYYAPVIILLTIYLEHLRQRFLIENSIENTMMHDLYSATLYDFQEDLISSDTLKDDADAFVPPMMGLPKKVDLEGSEATMLSDGETICWYKKQVILYGIHKWVEEPTYVTTTGVIGHIAVSETADWSDHEEHEDWEKFSVGELYVTNNHLIYYAPDKGKQHRNMICLSYNSLYFVQGHFDLNQILNCVRIRVNGDEPRDFVFHAGDENGDPDYEQNWNGSFVNAVLFSMQLRDIDPQYFGVPKENQIIE